jgi:hypothetical protein
VGLLRLFISADDEKLFTTHVADYEDKYIRELKAGDRLTIEAVLMQRNLTGGARRTPWSRVLAGSYSLRLGLFLDSDRSQLAYQNGFPNQDAWTKSDTLALDTAAAVAAVTATPFQAACTFEAEITDSNGNDRTVYRESVTLKKGLIDAAAVSPPVGEIAATVAMLRQMAVPKDGSDPLNPNNNIVMKSIGAGRKMMLVVNDDGTVVGIPI